MQHERTHYDVLGLTEVASTRDVHKAYLALAEKYYPVIYDDDEQILMAAARLREQAYFALGHPVRRAAYDRQMGYSTEYLAMRIGGFIPLRDLQWSGFWAVFLGFLVIVLLVGHENMSRMIGINFAPGYHEEFGGFYSTNASWEWVLNSWLVLSLGPALVVGSVAFYGGKVLDRTAGQIIASVRSNGHSDTGARAAIWLFTIIVPIAACVFLGFYGAGAGTP